MEIDPHTLQQILLRIQKQMRCPQCGKKVPVDFAAVRVVANESMLLQLKCEGCNAFIVLHASLQGADNLNPEEEKDVLANASSVLQVSEKEAKMLENSLEQCGGSFEQLFKKLEKDD